MRLLVHDTLATAPLVFPIRAGWVEDGGLIEAAPELPASAIGPDDIALIPAAEIAHLQETHLVVPDVAIVGEREGPIAMRSPVRPDAVQETAVRLYGTSGTAELLARATLRPFFGITPTDWTTEASAEAQVVIVEGMEAVREPEAGFAEDLYRAWFILTGQPVVSHLLVAPKGIKRVDLTGLLDVLECARLAAQERRRELRRSLADEYDLDRDRLVAVQKAQRFHLEEADRQALLNLFQRGARGSAYPVVREIAFLEPDEPVQ
ncbi:MAG TPA: MqnA/MqnD/SBP family protein [Thermomicrobiales bacterium]